MAGGFRGAKFNLVEAFRCSFLFLLSSSFVEVRVWEGKFPKQSVLGDVLNIFHGTFFDRVREGLDISSCYKIPYYKLR